MMIKVTMFKNVAKNGGQYENSEQAPSYSS